MPNRPTSAQLKVRLEPELRAKLESAAADRGVSLNRELGDRLRQSLADDGAPGRRNRAAQAIMRIVEEAMDAAGGSALFHLTHSWDVVRQKNWINDPYAYAQALAAGVEVLKEFTPPGDQAMQAVASPWDARFWAEFVLKQAATGEANAPEGQPLAQALHAGIGDLADRIRAMAKVDPTVGAQKRTAEQANKSHQGPSIERVKREKVLKAEKPK